MNVVPAFTIRRATAADRAFVRRLTVTAFAPYGDYDAIMEGWLSDPRTRTAIVEGEGAPAGFAIWASETARAADIVLVCLSLVPEQRGRGIGRYLLERVHAAIAEEVAGLPRRVSLDVAEENLPARALFRRAGYREVPGPWGSYPFGQRALRMAREVRSGPREA